MSPHAQAAITRLPMMPTTGSIQTQEKKRAASSPPIASTDVIASASTCR